MLWSGRRCTSHVGRCITVHAGLRGASATIDAISHRDNEFTRVGGNAATRHGLCITQVNMPNTLSFPTATRPATKPEARDPVTTPAPVDRVTAETDPLGL